MLILLYQCASITSLIRLHLCHSYTPAFLIFQHTLHHCYFYIPASLIPLQTLQPSNHNIIELYKTIEINFRRRVTALWRQKKELLFAHFLALWRQQYKLKFQCRISALWR